MNYQSFNHRRRGFSIVEMFVSSTVATLLAGVLVMGAYVLQRNFQASERYARMQASQMRVLDQLSLDLRRALTVTVGTSLTAFGAERMLNQSASVITMTVPDYYAPDGTPRNPTLKGGKVYYGDSAQPVTVRYTKNGSRIMREYAGVSKEVADGVQDFQFTLRDEGQVIEVSVSFIPTFQGTGRGVRDGTTTTVRTLLRNKRQT